MIAPVHKLRKDKIIWLGKHRCQHRHTYLEHYECYLKEAAPPTRIAHFDIETSNLKATYGILLCYCLLDHQTGEILHDCITKKDLNGNLDKRVVSSCVKDLDKFDVVVSYYGTKFDLPFIRTRATIYDIPFPAYGLMKHIDVYYTIRNKMRLHSNRLAVACESLLGSTEKTIIDPNRWVKALQGDKKALDYILEHCKRDVRDLQRLYNKVIDFRYPGMRSI